MDFSFTPTYIALSGASRLSGNLPRQSGHHDLLSLSEKKVRPLLSGYAIRHQSRPAGSVTKGMRYRKIIAEKSISRIDAAKFVR